MVIWGKLIGGAVGYIFGGWIAAGIGVIVGHIFDSDTVDDMIRNKKFNPFTIIREATGKGDLSVWVVGLISLAAKVTKADGRVTREEIITFRRVFDIPPNEERNVARIFKKARNSSEGYEEYAQQIARRFHADPQTLRTILQGLQEIARADGRMTPDEQACLRKVGEIFGVYSTKQQTASSSSGGAQQFNKISNQDADPYRILGIDRGTDNKAIKKIYRKLVQEHHPDRMIARGVSKRELVVAERKMAKINDAYDQIERERGL